MPHRPLIILATLPVLLLSSCEPGEDGANAGKHGSADDRKSHGPNFVANTANKERLAAQDSVGKPPEPQNMLKGIEDECPVHQEKMKVREIPIVYEDTASGKSESAKSPLDAKFPFAAQKIISAGNALLPGQPTSALVYVCASCVTARKAAEEPRKPDGTGE